MLLLVHTTDSVWKALLYFVYPHRNMELLKPCGNGSFSLSTMHACTWIWSKYLLILCREYKYNNKTVLVWPGSDNLTFLSNIEVKYSMHSCSIYIFNCSSVNSGGLSQVLGHSTIFWHLCVTIALSETLISIYERGFLFYRQMMI